MDESTEAPRFTKNSTSPNLPIHEQVRDFLLDQIQQGWLKAGDMLAPERKLAEDFGVSRHSVRQALSALESFGLIDIRHGSGIYITTSTSDDAIVRVAESVIDRDGSLINVVEARRGIEPFVAGLAAERRTDEDMERLRALISYQTDEERAARGLETTSFHRELALIAKNPVLDGIVRTLSTGARRAESLMEVVPEAREIWEREHIEIVEAIAAGDAEAAHNAMAAHVDSVLEIVRQVNSAQDS